MGKINGTVNEGVTWIGLPSYFSVLPHATSIIGYSESTARVYLRGGQRSSSVSSVHGKMSSLNGTVQLDLAPHDPPEDMISPVVVPESTRISLAEGLPPNATDYKGTHCCNT